MRRFARFDTVCVRMTPNRKKKVQIKTQSLKTSTLWTKNVNLTYTKRSKDVHVLPMFDLHPLARRYASWIGYIALAP